jgi:outer membrane lipoprotein-sorting protein
MNYIKEKTMNYRNTISLVLLLALAASLLSTVNANTGEGQGFEIAARSDRSDVGFKDSEVELQMVLRNAAGQQSSRSLRIATLEKPDETVGDKSLVIFDTPRDIEGTALLSHAHILDPDDQWLYLPALKRVKRISSSNKSGPFVGSEFAFEDFTAIELNKFDYRLLQSEPCGDLNCDVLERLPLYENSGYAKQMAWVDQTDFQIRKVEFYDRRGDLLKVLEMKDYRQYENGVWRAHTLSMSNVQTNKQTDLIYGDYTFGAGMTENEFVKGRLSRLR